MSIQAQDVTKQSSIQIDPEWRAMLSELADRWGFRKGRHVSPILRSCTRRILELERQNDTVRGVPKDEGHD